MPDPITWNDLVKAIGDLTTISEEIDTKILTHNLDASAHGQADEAVYMHRINSLLDHVNYSIYNIKLHPETRTVKAFVDIGGAAEFSTIQEAIDYTHALGGGKVFVKAGTYTNATDLILYTNIELEGEDNDTTIIDFNNTANKIKAEGNAGLHLKNIHVSNLKFVNRNSNANGAVYFYYCDDISVKNCKFDNNVSVTTPFGNSIRLDQCTRAVIRENYLSSGDYFVYATTSTKVEIIENQLEALNYSIVKAETVVRLYVHANYSTGTNDVAIRGSDCSNAQITDNHLILTSNDGINMSLSTFSDRCIIANNYIEVNEDCVIGIDVSGDSDNCIIIANIISGGIDTGIWLDDGDNTLVANNQLVDNAVGILIDNTCDRSNIIGNNLYTCTTKITNNGTNTSQTGNITA